MDKGIDMPDGFWDDAELVPPLTKTAISLRVDADVLAFFKAQGDGHLTRMNMVLRTYMERKKVDRVELVVKEAK